MTQYMKGPETTVLNSVFVHTQYVLTVFSSNQDAKQDMHIQVVVELFDVECYCDLEMWVRGH